MTWSRSNREEVIGLLWGILWFQAMDHDGWWAWLLSCVAFGMFAASILGAIVFARKDMRDDL